MASKRLSSLDENVNKIMNRLVEKFDITGVGNDTILGVGSNPTAQSAPSTPAGHSSSSSAAPTDESGRKAKTQA